MSETQTEIKTPEQENLKAKWDREARVISQAEDFAGRMNALTRAFVTPIAESERTKEFDPNQHVVTLEEVFNLLMPTIEAALRSYHTLRNNTGTTLPTAAPAGYDSATWHKLGFPNCNGKDIAESIARIGLNSGETTRTFANAPKRRKVR